MTYRIETSAHSDAPPAAVFALLADGNTWPVWGRWHRYELAVPDQDGGQGPGAERIFFSSTMGRTVASRERVLSSVPDSEVRYELVSGLPLKGYVGVVRLVPDGGGTRIAWSAGFESAAWGQGWLYRMALDRFIADTVRRLARHAEQV